jgi:lipopolysaccharide transport system ATP-binding protein
MDECGNSHKTLSWKIFATFCSVLNHRVYKYLFLEGVDYVSETVIRVENVGKKYILSHRQKVQSYQTLRDIIADGVKSLGGNFLKPQETKLNDPTHEEFWALKDVSFEIKQGKRVGIIGRNGAGKSTLLKILSRITNPTQGIIKIKGRVASLLEVGTGFHPELTGRENIYLNGVILGMGKEEVKHKFDEIVAFAEVEKFLDTPVKRYSSGMYVRLAFAVAAHLEPEILIVDEVLAVGDISFQKKCLGKMQDISNGEGRTVIFVSHSMDAIQRLCTDCIMFERGQLVSYGSPAQIIPRYLTSNNSSQALPNQWIDVSKNNRIGTGEARFMAVQYSSLNEAVEFQPFSCGTLEFLLDIKSTQSSSFGGLAVAIFNQAGTILVNADIAFLGQTIFLCKGNNIIQLRIHELYLRPGIYVVGLWLDRTGAGHMPIDSVESAFEIEVIDKATDSMAPQLNIKTSGCVICKFSILEVKSSV